MSLYRIERDGVFHGPYDINAIKFYVQEGNILIQDKVVYENGGKSSVRVLLKTQGIKPRIKHNGNILKQIQSFGLNLLFPKDSISIKTLKSDQKFLIIALVGLLPAFLIRFTGASVFTFYAIALYFSLVWGLFFYSVFKTDQVSSKKTIAIFFSVQILIFISVYLINIPSFNPFYSLINENNSIFSKLIGYVLGVGLFEEFIKLLPVYLLVRYSDEPLLPQTVVFYGLISGIGFGVFEGVTYQLGVNTELDYNNSFFMNIARLTSLPFLHAIWSGISSYFISFAFLYPTNRFAIILISISIPALLHGLYDTFTWSLIGLFFSYLGVALLVIYLKNAKKFQQKIIK
ncbi:MAG: PrsW family intramembrane metalloprotease [Bacteroidia bacterium]|nr:PrsW family intramembrane metalloprotease [Bacteroidia bacterium]MCF8428331.1 PrsW family intramembrane metalloprotease [Bacteroidia bacterium]MCF8447066.1 PrsW family intramembrane metalloprotease [Bacteroidia bacterium]